MNESRRYQLRHSPWSLAGYQPTRINPKPAGHCPDARGRSYSRANDAFSRCSKTGVRVSSSISGKHRSPGRRQLCRSQKFLGTTSSPRGHRCSHDELPPLAAPRHPLHPPSAQLLLDTGHPTAQVRQIAQRRDRRVAHAYQAVGVPREGQHGAEQQQRAAIVTSAAAWKPVLACADGRPPSSSRTGPRDRIATGATGSSASGSRPEVSRRLTRPTRRRCRP